MRKLKYLFLFPDGGRTTLPGWTVGASTHDKFISPSMAWFCAPGPIGFYNADLGDAIRFGVDGPESGGSSAGGGGIFGGSFWDGGIGWNQLKNDEKGIKSTSTIIEGEGEEKKIITTTNYESEDQFNESIAPGFQSLSDIVGDHYNAFVNSFGTFVGNENPYDRKMKGYGHWSKETIVTNSDVYSIDGITGKNGVISAVNFIMYDQWHGAQSNSNELSSTVTLSSGKQIISSYESPYGDYYEQSSNVSYVLGNQKKINTNVTIENGKIRNYDISHNNGAVRTTVRTDGVINTSIGIGNYRFGVGISQDFITTFSTTYRSNNGFGVTMNYSYRAGGNTLGYFGSTLILLLTPEFIPVLGPATVPVIP